MMSSNDSAKFAPLLSGLAQLALDPRGRDLGSARQIDDLALVLEEVELAFPIVTHHKGFDVVLLHVSRLLFPVVFRNDEVNVADGLEHVLALFIGEVRFLPLPGIELIARQCNDQVVALLFASLEQSNVPIMEQVESSVSDDSFHC